jgi:hypothetical protein
MPQIDGVADHATPTTVADPSSVEPKVTAATAAATAATFVLWLLTTYVFHGDVPAAVQGAVGLVVTGGGTFVAGYLTRHVNREA